MSLIATFQQGRALYEKQEFDNSLYYEVRSTWDLFGMSRVTQNKVPLSSSLKGLPDMWRIHPRSTKFPNDKTKPDFVRLDYEHTHYLVKINAEVQKNKLFTSKEAYFAWWQNTSELEREFYIRELGSALKGDRSHSNEFGLDEMHNWLTGQRADKDDPRFFQLITGRFKAKAKLENGQLMQRNIAGAGLCGAFECIDASGDYWQYSPLTHPHLFDRSPIYTARETAYANGSWYIVRDDKHEFFPQFNERLVFPFWLPYDTIAYIPVNQLRLVEPGEHKTAKRLDGRRL